jgi:hypothetical protein
MRMPKEMPQPNWADDIGIIYGLLLIYVVCPVAAGAFLWIAFR